MKYSRFSLCLLFILILGVTGASAEEDEYKVKLEFKLRAGRTYVYTITSSRSVQGDMPVPMFWQTDKQITKAVQRTEDGNFLLETSMEKDMKQRNVAVEYFRRNYPLYQIELSPDGTMTTPPRQPFPAVRNVPVFPSYEVSKGDKWVVEDVPFYPGGIIDEISADWEYELIEFIKHNDFNSAHIKATATIAFERRPITIAFLGFFGDPEHEEDGAYIKELVSDSPAAAAGLLPGDQIITIADVKLTDWWDIPELLPYLPPGQDISVEYKRGDVESEATFTTGVTEIGEVEGIGTFTFDIYFGVSRGHVISMEGKTDNLTLRLYSENGEEEKLITSRIYMEFLPEG
jgi:membrane-associated protease RseP (regulator of RpoE activity)